jgi:acyl-CoA reductase-like NAD-dependent aldehyde dehydrogenase
MSAELHHETTEGFMKLRAAASDPNDNLSYASLVAELRGTFQGGVTKDLVWRRQQLEQVCTMVKESYEEMAAAICADLGGSKIRGLCDFIGIYGAAEYALKYLDKWTAAQQVSTPVNLSMSRLGKSYIRQEPKGVALIIGPWNFPLDLCLTPLVSAIAAGCCVVIKPSEVAQASGQLLEKLVKKYLDTSCIKVVQGAVAETKALLRERWDHIFYTGNGAIGRIVLRAAAEHLTSVTLELGGKSPVIIDKSAKMKSVVSRVSAAKWFNAGQICIAPDYVLVHKDREEEFISEMKKQLQESYGSDPKQSIDFGRIINSSHVRRVSELLEKTQGEVVAGGISQVDSSARYFPPTIVRDAKLGEPLLTDEIFGPVLPVIAVDSVEDAVRKTKEVCDQPLALYVFSEDAKATAQVLDNTISGGGCINTCFEHVASQELPFGGFGSSGCGAYHGKAGFDEFTHRRSILHQDTLIQRGAGLPPPAPVPKNLYDILVKATITGFLTDAQRKQAKVMLGAVGAACVGAALRSRL